jgi:hypothetical protein
MAKRTINGVQMTDAQAAEYEGYAAQSGVDRETFDRGALAYAKTFPADRSVVGRGGWKKMVPVRGIGPKSLVDAAMLVQFENGEPLLP